MTQITAFPHILVLTRLWYATLRLRPAYAETGGMARLRVSLPLAFWGLRPLRVLRPPRDAEASIEFGN